MSPVSKDGLTRRFTSSAAAGARSERDSDRNSTTDPGRNIVKGCNLQIEKKNQWLADFPLLYCPSPFEI